MILSILRCLKLLVLHLIYARLSLQLTKENYLILFFIIVIALNAMMQVNTGRLFYKGQQTVLNPIRNTWMYLKWEATIILNVMWNRNNTGNYKIRFCDFGFKSWGLFENYWKQKNETWHLRVNVTPI